ncbi:MAG: hypothetical protein GY914_09205 [Prochlorococcus sp.]|nr:hypothetical protein [Prochlorococcus sp.]
MNDDNTEFVKVEEANGQVAVFFEGDYMCFYNHLMNVGIDKATAKTLRETYKTIL